MEWFQIVMNPLVDIQGNLFPIFGIFDDDDNETQFDFCLCVWFSE